MINPRVSRKACPWPVSESKGDEKEVTKRSFFLLWQEVGSMLGLGASCLCVPQQGPHQGNCHPPSSEAATLTSSTRRAEIRNGHSRFSPSSAHHQRTNAWTGSGCVGRSQMSGLPSGISSLRTKTFPTAGQRLWKSHCSFPSSLLLTVCVCVCAPVRA